MEKKEIQDRIENILGFRTRDGVTTVNIVYRRNLKELFGFISQELDKAREEGYSNGWGDCERFAMLIEKQYGHFPLTKEEEKELNRLSKQLKKLQV